MSSPSHETPVLIVGGGIVGLSAGLFLQYHGVPFILVEQNSDVSPLPRARGFSARSLELYRSVGLQEAIEAAARAAWKQGQFGGARRGTTLLDAEPLAQASVAALHATADPSPCELTACPQTLIEPILRRALEERGGDVRFGSKVARWDRVANGVVAHVIDPEGTERQIAADYLLAADGARSGIRRELGITRRGSEAERHYLNIFFTADLASMVAGRTFSQCEVANDRVSGVFLAMDNATRWSFHLAYDPATEQPANWSDAEVADLVRAAIGHDVPVTVHFRGVWNTRVKVADDYAAGPIFLLGDAAHVMPPWGGFNANTGIADAHNLAWRLARVHTGLATSTLLEGYASERRPVAVRNGEQARLRTDFDARFQISTPSNAAQMEEMVDYGALQMRYRYGADDTVERLHAQSGTRFPHAWIIREGRRVSTLDLFGRYFISIGGPKAINVDLRAEVDFIFEDSDASWVSLTGLDEDGAVVVRPDGFVCSEEA